MSAAAGKFSRNVAWNVASLAVAGACGILLNYLISLIYGVGALGSFNQVFAIYILASQVGVLGVHQSALQEIAVADDVGEQGASASSALAITALIGVVISAALWLAAPLFGAFADSADVARGIAWVAPGVFLFAVNKVGLSCLNGRGYMRWYALLSAGRFVFMLAAFGVCVVTDAHAGTLPVVLTAAEAAILVLVLFPSRDLLRFLPWAELRRRVRTHLAFGGKGFLSGVFAELNTRVDVLMLGYFHTDAVVGVYSFAAILAEGIFQLLIVLRVNYAPTVARLLAKGEREELMATIRRGQLRTYLVALPAGALAVLGYALMVPLVTTDPALAESWPYFAVLIGGMVSCAGYVPFSQVLLHGRLPGWHSVYILAIVVINIVANAALIPTYGSMGAAVGTAIAYAATAVVLTVFSRRLLALPL